MSIRIEQASYGSLHYVLSHLCEDDRTELLATAWSEARLADNLSVKIMQNHILALVAVSDDENSTPITAFGLVPMCPGVAVAWAFSTKDYNRAVIPVTRWIRTVGTAFAISAGYHRIECRAMPRPFFARWMTLIGAKPEAKLERFGQNGEDFILWRWLAYEHALQRAAKAERSAQAGNGR